MNLLKIITLFIVLQLSFSCNKEETDQELLQKDKDNLAESLKTDKVAKYKFLKIAIRSSVPMEQYPKEFLPFKEKMFDLSETLTKADKKNPSLLEMASIYKDYLDLKGVIDETDEDVFPTLVEAINYHSDEEKKSITFISGNKKMEQEGYEHAALGILVLLAQELGQEIAYYELSEIQPDKIQDKEVASIMQFYRGLLFSTKRLYYLSENELTQNINWLDSNKELDLEIIKLIFNWRNLNQQQSYLAYHSLNFLFRGIDRLAMEREIDEKRGLEDFEVFLADWEKLGFSNELVWTVEAYVNIKKENNQKAIVALRKLKESPILSNGDKEDVEETILYLEKRESGKSMNALYDKAFISKIIVSFVYDKLTKIDWEQVLKESEVENSEAILEAVQTFKKVNKQLQDINDMTYLKDKTSKVEAEGTKLWDKAKSLVE